MKEALKWFAKNIWPWNALHEIMLSLIAHKLKVYFIQFIFIAALIPTWNGKVRVNTLEEACKKKKWTKKSKKKRSQLIFYKVAWPLEVFEGRENRIMWLQDQKLSIWSIPQRLHKINFHYTTWHILFCSYIRMVWWNFSGKFGGCNRNI